MLATDMWMMISVFHEASTMNREDQAFGELEHSDGRVTEISGELFSPNMRDRMMVNDVGSSSIEVNAEIELLGARIDGVDTTEEAIECSGSF